MKLTISSRDGVLPYRMRSAVSVISMFVIFVGLVLSNALTESFDTRGNLPLSVNQSFWESRLTTHIPMLKMLKRHVRWLNDGKSVVVTLVYQATQPVKTRWFRRHGDKRLAQSEVHRYLPVEGDPNCTLTFMRSGEVTAATLTIRGLKNRYAPDIVTILTTMNGTIQYQLHTILQTRSGQLPATTKPELIDSPEWLLVPPAKIEYHPQGGLDIHCAVFLPKDKSSYINDLVMSYTTLTKKWLSKTADLVVIHNNTQDVIERQQESAMTIGKRYRTKHDHVVYHVGFSSWNTTFEYSGIYQCSVIRKLDSLYVMSYVLMSGAPPVLPLNPIVDLLSCELNNTSYNKARGTTTLTLTEGVATCFRCRAVAHPTPTVAAYRNEGELLGRPGIGVTKYTNVVEAGVSEATYTYHHPVSSDSGSYSCRAKNSAHSVPHTWFNIVVVKSGRLP